MSGTRKILILGNGFDLAHFLPTKYDHFMHAMRNVENYNKDVPMTFESLYTDLIDSENYFFENTIKLYKTEEATLPLEEVKELQYELKKNGWFQYFKSYIDSGIETWIDFENEIERVLNIICEVLVKNTDKNEFIDSKNDYSDRIIVDSKFFEEFNANEEFFINIFLKFEILQKVYYVADSEFPKLSEVNKSEYEAHIPIKDIYSDFAIKKQIKYSINNKFLRHYKCKVISLELTKIIRHLEAFLSEFIDIFSIYIAIIDELEVQAKLKKPKVLESNLEAIYSFNYSSTIERLYDHLDIRFLHGKAGETDHNTIVLGISELHNQLLIDEKAYGFVKYYQKLINNTDYQFLKPNSLATEAEDRKNKSEGMTIWEPIEIYIWGHSLDSSDSDYINEIFSFNKGKKNSIRVIVYYYDKPHAQMANLISILGKDIVESWMKKKWLEFMKMPNIYKLNFDNSYVDSSISIFSNNITESIRNIRPNLSVY